MRSGIYRDPQLLQGTIVPQDLFDRVSEAPTDGSSSPRRQTALSIPLFVVAAIFTGLAGVLAVCGVLAVIAITAARAR